MLIGLIAIALFAAIAASGIYYGGDVWTEGTLKANAATVLAQSDQINAAVQLYKAANGKYPDFSFTLDPLVSAGYLSAVPTLPAGVADPDAARTTWYVLTTSVAGYPDETYLTYMAAVNTASAERKAEAERLCLMIMEKSGVAAIPSIADTAPVSGSLPSGYGCTYNSVNRLMFRKRLY